MFEECESCKRTDVEIFHEYIPAMGRTARLCEFCLEEIIDYLFER